MEEIIARYAKVRYINSKAKICNSIEYCVGIGSIEHLFDNLLDDLINNDQYDQNLEYFFQVIGDYILSQEIKIIPANLFEAMADYYMDQNRQNKLEKIILHLDPKLVDHSIAVNICEKHDLILSQIFICTNSIPYAFEKPLILLLKKFGEQNSQENKNGLLDKIL